ncbi:MAG: hypothetical protein K2I79_00640, partial [Clostridia bacterium]|nr:hypothetical protein [Clostridia bacterium]
LQLMQLGVLQDSAGRLDERSKSKVLEILGFGAWEGGADISDSQRNSAVRENMMADTKAPEVSEIDDHDIHIAEHIKAALSHGEEDEVRQRLIEHIRSHKEMKIMQAEPEEGINNFGDA